MVIPQHLSSSSEEQWSFLDESLLILFLWEKTWFMSHWLDHQVEIRRFLEFFYHLYRGEQHASYGIASLWKIIDRGISNITRSLIHWIHVPGTAWISMAETKAESLVSDLPFWSVGFGGAIHLVSAGRGVTTTSYNYAQKCFPTRERMTSAAASNET